MGDGTTTDRYTPTATPSLGTARTAVAITAAQTACAAGSFQANTGQSACTDASAGYDGDSTAQTAQTACLAAESRRYNWAIILVLLTSSDCLDADAGNYVGSTGQSSQTACAAGTYQASTGQSSCTDASAGYYVDSTAQTAQTACAAGTYQCKYWFYNLPSDCLDADAGNYVGSTGQSSQTACAAGNLPSMQQEHTKQLLDNLPVLMLQQDTM